MQQFQRFEFKYIITPTEATIIRNMLLKFGMQHDPAASKENHTYTVNSLYFDTPRVEDYADKAGGFLERKKVRIRIYTPKLTRETPQIWLEKKEKYEMLISKRRTPLTYDSYNALVSGSYLSAIKGKDEFYDLVRESMRPHIEVRYLREPLIWPQQSNLRITFDAQIEAAKNSDLRLTRLFQKVLPGKVVMEVKFLGALPYWYHKILKEFNLERTAFSKYGRSVETIYKYHPIPR